MTDRPIIFSVPMVRALLREAESPGDGKTMTRRLAWVTRNGDDAELFPSPWQKVKPGDRLWVRENWKPYSTYATVRPRDIPMTRIFYAADGGSLPGNTPWRPSIFMPRWGSRLTLTVTATKIEPLLDITEADAIAEGFREGVLDDGFGPQDIGGGITIESSGTLASAVGMFQITWEKLHPDWDGYSSPDVVALTFTVALRNIDMENAA